MHIRIPYSTYKYSYGLYIEILSTVSFFRVLSHDSIAEQCLPRINPSLARTPYDVAWDLFIPVEICAATAIRQSHQSSQGKKKSCWALFFESWLDVRRQATSMYLFHPTSYLSLHCICMKRPTNPLKVLY
jgi:hypothetical protein